MRYRSGFQGAMYFAFMVILFLLIFMVRYGLSLVLQKEAPTSTEGVIIWHDRGLEAAIKSAMGLSIEEDVEISDASQWPGDIGNSYGMYYLTLEGEDIKNIEDLKYFTNLRNLVLKDTNISDLSPLLSLKKLDGLKIYGGNIKELDMVGKMEGLSSLSLYDVPVSSIRPLENMYNLRHLSLGGIPINDISALGLLGKLSWITLERLPLTDVSSLEYLRNLRELEIIDMPVEKIPPLTNALELLTLKKTNVSDISGIPDSVRVLKLWGNQINNFSSLCSLPNLTDLYITDEDLSKQSPRFTFQKLEFLSIRNCNLSDISLLGYCAKLDTLDLEDNELESIRGIEKFTSLNTLIISNNKLQKIDGLEMLPYLTWLDLSKNPVQDLKPLADIHSLKRLDLSGINLKDVQLDKLLDMPDLEALLLNDCGLKDIKFMKKFKSIHGLHISKNQISDISGIANMNTSLKLNEVVLDLSYNPIIDLSPLAKCEKFSLLDLSGIDLKNTEGLETLRNLYIQNLIAKDCNLDSLNPISALSEARGGVWDLSLADNQLSDLSIIINGSWDVSVIDVSDNLITEKYLEEIGAFKVSPGRYQYGGHMMIKVH